LNGTQYFYEQAIKVIEQTCQGQSAATLLQVDRYEISSLASMQLAFVVTAGMFGMYHVVAMAVLVAGTNERPLVRQAPLPLVSSIMRSLNNAAFRPLLTAWALDGLTLAVRDVALTACTALRLASLATSIRDTKEIEDASGALTTRNCELRPSSRLRRKYLSAATVFY
jgi:hypothetical protein